MTKLLETNNDTYTQHVHNSYVILACQNKIIAQVDMVNTYYIKDYLKIRAEILPLEYYNQKSLTALINFLGISNKRLHQDIKEDKSFEIQAPSNSLFKINSDSSKQLNGYEHTIEFYLKNPNERIYLTLDEYIKNYDGVDYIDGKTTEKFTYNIENYLQEKSYSDET